MNPELTLYTFRRCPYAIRARLILKLIAQKFRPIEVSLKNKPQEMLELSPKGTVPVLLISGTTTSVIDESLDIIHWALQQRYPKNWRKLTEAEEKKAQSLQKRITSNFVPALNTFKYAFSDQAKEKEKAREELESFLREIDLGMAGNHSILETPSWIDVSFVPFLRQLRISDPLWFDALHLNKLHLWLEHWTGSEEFVEIMKKL